MHLLTEMRDSIIIIIIISTAVSNFKPERWRLPLVQEKYREEKVCYKRYNNNDNNNNNNNNNR
jgi:hypothetical protein